LDLPQQMQVRALSIRQLVSSSNVADMERAKAFLNSSCLPWSQALRKHVPGRQAYWVLPMDDERGWVRWGADGRICRVLKPWQGWTQTGLLALRNCALEEAVWPAQPAGTVCRPKMAIGMNLGLYLDGDTTRKAIRLACIRVTSEWLFEERSQR